MVRKGLYEEVICEERALNEERKEEHSCGEKGKVDFEVANTSAVLEAGMNYMFEGMARRSV